MRSPDRADILCEERTKIKAKAGFAAQKQQYGIGRKDIE